MTPQAVLHAIVVACFAYLLVVNLSYLALALVGLVENRTRRRESAAEDYETMAGSRFTIPVSVVLAAYDEESAIVATVRSLLAQNYPEFEVIVVNDGSKDGTLGRLRDEFGLDPYEVFSKRFVETEPVRAIYRSAEHPNLIVVDKDNGGKADALNAGLNLARFRYICGVDADTVFARDALLKSMRLVMADPAHVIGVTSHLSIALDPAKTMADPVGKRRLSHRPLLAYQHLDYLRAFFNNRLGWSRLDFMLCAVGAFQVWRRDVIEEVGGFARGFTCEDIELTFRIHERYLRLGCSYQILCLPDNVGTTEGPNTVRKLVAQRERWQRVIDETVWHYRGMILNPRYKRVGLLGMPYYILSEVIAPLFELVAFFSLPLALALGVFDWQMFALTAALISFLNGTLTTIAILGDDRQSRLYAPGELVRLLLLAPLELVLYRPILVWARLKGTWRFLRGDKGWYKFERNERAAAAS
jgi:cellulose synthase/poly-beta-1,6-N-acetylglucosamine synthase-like glycosyltransferase